MGEEAAAKVLFANGFQGVTVDTFWGALYSQSYFYL